jgi:hypothetical protein
MKADDLTQVTDKPMANASRTLRHGWQAKSLL